MFKEIMIGGILHNVPVEYITEESKYCLAEYTAFETGLDSNISESELSELREAVLEKRVDFYEKWNRGKIVLPVAEQKEIGYWQKILNHLYE